MTLRVCLPCALPDGEALEGPTRVYRHLEVGGREPFVQPKHREDESGPVYRGAQGAMHRK